MCGFSTVAPPPNNNNNNRYLSFYNEAIKNINKLSSKEALFTLSLIVNGSVPFSFSRQNEAERRIIPDLQSKINKSINEFTGYELSNVSLLYNKLPPP